MLANDKQKCQLDTWCEMWMCLCACVLWLRAVDVSLWLCVVVVCCGFVCCGFVRCGFVTTPAVPKEWLLEF